jgi:PilZ domain-containing protein
MARPLVDRRREARVGHPEIAGAQAILRPGYAVSLVNLSAGGALIQGPRPLRPGAHVHMQLLTGTRRLTLAGRVLRCSVAALDWRDGVLYRGAVQFDHRCEPFWEGATRDGYFVPGDDRTATSRAGHGLPAVHPSSDDGFEHPRQ